MNENELSTGTLDENKPVNGNKNVRKVSMAKMVQVMLIPHFMEYEEAGLSEQLWWTKAQLETIKQATKTELEAYVLQNPTQNYKQARSALYDPERDEQTTPTPMGSGLGI